VIKEGNYWSDVIYSIIKLSKK